MLLSLLIVFIIIVLLVVFLLYKNSHTINGGAYGEVYPIYMNETYLKKLLNDGLHIAKSDTGGTLLKTDVEQYTSVYVDKTDDARPTKYRIAIVNVPNPPYISRVKDFLNRYYNRQIGLLTAEAEKNTDIYKISATGDVALVHYTKLHRFEIEGREYVLFMQPDLELLAHDVCYPDYESGELKFEDKIKYFINLYRDVYGINVGWDGTNENDLYKLAFYDLYLFTNHIKPDQHGRYYNFVNNIVQNCYKYPCLKQKIHIDIFNINKFGNSEAVDVTIAFSSRKFANESHIKLFEYINSFINKNLFKLYYPDQDFNLLAYMAHIRFDKRFNIIAEYVPNVGNIDTKPYELYNSMTLKEFIYSLSIPDFNKNYDHPAFIYGSGGIDTSYGIGRKEKIRYDYVENLVNSISEELLQSANKVLSSPTTKIIYVELHVGFTFGFVTNTGHYFKFILNPTINYKTISYLANRYQLKKMDKFTKYENTTIYRIKSNILPYTLSEFYKISHTKGQSLEGNIIRRLHPSYQYDITKYKPVLLKLAPNIVEIINKAKNAETTIENGITTINKQVTNGEVVIKEDNIVHYFANSRYINGDIEKYDKYVFWSFDRIIFDKLTLDNLDKPELFYEDGLFKFDSILLIKDDDVDKCLLMLEQFKKHCTKKHNYVPDNIIITRAITGSTTMVPHFKLESGRHAYYKTAVFTADFGYMKYSYIYYDAIVSKTSVYKNYYANLSFTIKSWPDNNAFYNDLSNPDAFHGDLHLKTGTGSTDSDSDMLQGFSNLFNRADVYYEKKYIEVSDFMQFQSEELKKLNLTKSVTKLLDYYKNILLKNKKAFYNNGFNTLKILTTHINIIKKIVSNSAIKKILICSSCIGVVAGYKYDRKLDYAFAESFEIDSLRESKYRASAIEENSKSFNVMHNNIDEIDTKYEFISAMFTIINKKIKHDGPILGVKFMPKIIEMTSKLLNNLVEECDCLFRLSITYPTSVFKKYVFDLMQSFDSVEVSFMDTVISIYCKKYKSNKFSSLEYTYRDVTNVFYNHSTHTIPEVNFIEENEEISKICSQGINHIVWYYNNINYLLFGDIDYNTLIVDEIANIIKIMDENLMPYNIYYASLITKYYEKAYNRFITLNSPINSIIINYDNVRLTIDTHCNPYHYDYQIGHKLQSIEKIYESIDPTKFAELDEGRKIYQDLTIGVAKYLQSKNIYRIKVSNAFVKLWEIYYTHQVLPVTTINAFHMCEAPGQWIKTTEEYIRKNKLTVKYNWLANSLNPTNPDNIKKFGNNIIDDRYSLIKNNKSKWIFGDDDTGDITIPDNIRWYRNKFRNEGINLNLVTGDAGLPIDMPLSYLQKLDYAQCILTLAVSNSGANCVIKCFSPYMKSNPDTLKATGFFVNLMYLYSKCYETLYLYKPYTSRPHSGEFYIVGKTFTGITEENLDKLLYVLGDFSENKVFIAEDNISKNFELLIKDFIERLSNQNIEVIELGSFINNCLTDSEDLFGLRKFIQSDEIVEIQKKRFKTFCQNFNLI